jgi:hypothetical protein
LCRRGQRVIGTVRRELLDPAVILGERHLAPVLRGYAEHDSGHRPRQSRRQQPPDIEAQPARDMAGLRPARRKRAAAGVVNEYRQHPSRHIGEAVTNVPGQGLAEFFDCVADGLCPVHQRASLPVMVAKADVSLECHAPPLPSAGDAGLKLSRYGRPWRGIRDGYTLSPCAMRCAATVWAADPQQGRGRD